MSDRVTVQEFRRHVRAALVRSGDCVLFDYGARSLSDWVIRRVQRRCLRDLAGRRIGDADAAMCSKYVHAAMVADHRMCLEMTTPACRYSLWADRLRPGDRVLIVRPVGGMPFGDRERAMAVRLMRCRVGDPYPLRELMAYYAISWGWHKLLRRRTFAAVFASRRSDVCSGSIWAAWTDAGAVSPDGFDRYPEAWYPARMAWDAMMGDVDGLRALRDEPESGEEKTGRRHLRTVAEFVIGDEQTGDDR